MNDEEQSKDPWSERTIEGMRERLRSNIPAEKTEALARFDKVYLEQMNQVFRGVLIRSYSGQCSRKDLEDIADELASDIRMELADKQLDIHTSMREFLKGRCSWGVKNKLRALRKHQGRGVAGSEDEDGQKASNSEAEDVHFAMRLEAAFDSIPRITSRLLEDADKLSGKSEQGWFELVMYMYPLKKLAEEGLGALDTYIKRTQGDAAKKYDKDTSTIKRAKDWWGGFVNRSAGKLLQEEGLTPEEHDFLERLISCKPLKDN